MKSSEKPARKHKVTVSLNDIDEAGKVKKVSVAMSGSDAMYYLIICELTRVQKAIDAMREDECFRNETTYRARNSLDDMICDFMNHMSWETK